MALLESDDSVVAVSIASSSSSSSLSALIKGGGSSSSKSMGSEEVRSVLDSGWTRAVTLGAAAFIADLVLLAIGGSAMVPSVGMPLRSYCGIGLKSSELGGGMKSVFFFDGFWMFGYLATYHLN